MKRLVCVMALSGLLWPACSTQQNAPSRTENKEAEAARHERQMYQDNIEAKLRDLDQQIETLRTNLGSQKRVDRKQLKQQMAELERKREAAQKQLEKLENSSQEAWRDMKTGIDAAMADLETAYQHASSHFK